MYDIFVDKDSPLELAQLQAQYGILVWVMVVVYWCDCRWVNYIGTDSCIFI